jgi:hypothetical protein
MAIFIHSHSFIASLAHSQHPLPYLQIGTIYQPHFICPTMPIFKTLVSAILFWASCIGFTAAADFAELDRARVNALSAQVQEQPQGIGPACADRGAWGASEIAVRTKPLVAAANKLLVQTFPAWNDEAYLEYSQKGTRPGGEKMMNARKAWLYPLVIAECASWDGKYLKAIAQTLEELDRQPTWTWPAHDKGLRNFRLRQFEVDLLAADTAHDIAQTLYMLGDRIDPALRALTTTALEQRVFGPMRKRFVSGGSDHWWLKADRNWNAVCLKGVVTAALTVLPGRADRALFVAAGEHYIQRYIGGFPADGYSLEGPGYWNYGVSHFVELRQVLMDTTAGRLDLFNDIRVLPIALYGFRIEVNPDNIAAFGDAPRNTRMDALTRAYLNQTFNLGAPQLLSTLPITSGQSGNGAPIAEAAFKLFVNPTPRSGATQTPSMVLHSYFDQAQVLISRPTAQQKLGVAFKAGGNESHSHNDVGSYTIMLGAEQPTGDPGNTVYSAKTFSKDRYTIKGINSYGHPVPLVAGQLQADATKVHAKVLTTRFTDASAEMVVNMAPAYPDVPLRKLTRTLVHDRSGAGAVRINDQFEFASAQSFEVALIAPDHVQALPDGSLDLWQKAEHLQAIITASAPYDLVFEPVNEEGLAFTRVAVRLRTLSANGSVQVLYQPASAVRE